MFEGWWDTPESVNEKDRLKEKTDETIDTAQIRFGKAGEQLKEHAAKAFDASGPIAAVIQDRPLMTKLLKSAALGGSALYLPSLFLLPTKEARKGAALFGAGFGVGWAIREVAQKAERISGD